MPQPMMPPECERPDQIDTLLNKLFSISDEIELQQIKGQTQSARALLADGLGISCQLVRRIEEEKLLRSVNPSEAVRRLKQKKTLLDSFLQSERALLSMTKLDQHVTEYLLGKLEALLLSEHDLPKDWKNDLDLLTTLICTEARAVVPSAKPSLLKRAIIAGGGGLIGLLNLLPPPGITLPPDVSTLSASAGTWMISEAFHDQLKQFFSS